jgi:cysteine desulfuration protein SufE
MQVKTNEIDAIISEFQLFDDWEDKYAYLIDLGKKLPVLENDYKTEANKVHGCTSQVWVIIDHKPEAPDRIFFRADSDAFIVKGLIALLLRIYSGKTSQEIKEIDIQQLFDKLELSQYLTPNRSNGFFAMVQRIRQLVGKI